ncbi:tRNA epoxyqueuosine(34) reductase QueG [Picosynechococcus sp. NKBG15041c]|uniref:tRNA epoxyqueuosine(34) reductase QueG n=1 Tax=Picosynechococcus sp. NKBG15041c TaxID=1407650 RepID=UPI000428777B|nr:tRNA epoxyqueuosine(34) reductase QueG [Picosynechococcus sp. NKBG15041c]
MGDRQTVTNEIKQQALKLGFHLVGIADATVTDSQNQQRLQSWLYQGFQAEMAWMANPKRQDIQQCLPGVQSVIAVGLNYYTPHQHSDDLEVGKIARYGWGRDYHKVLTKRLKALCRWLTAAFPDAQHRFYVDTGPVQDKVWAERAGLGWIAKNSNLITRDYGSWVFLGEILTTLNLAPDRPHLKHCGTCTRCIEACPTGAIASPFTVDANRCIAYHTIENRTETLPQAIAQNLNNWVAGCDICQDVCPWNQRFAQETNILDFQSYPENLAPKLTELAELTEDEWDRRFTGSALRRIKPAMWRRNAQANLSAQQKTSPNSEEG